MGEENEEEPLRSLLLGTLLIALLVGSALVDEGSGVAIWRELRADLGRSEGRVARLVEENERLRREIARLERDPSARDRALREDLDLAAPGEVVVRFVSATDPRGRAGMAAVRAPDERGRSTK